jgi:hypothetical protein
MNRLLFVAAALGVLAMGCKPATDLNQPCQLVKRNPDGGRPLQITEGEVRNAQGSMSSTKDFISVGSVQCEDLICVRDSDFQSDAGMNEPASGYCSRACAQNSACPSFDEALDTGPNALRCRALLLSAETLAAIRGDAGLPGIYDSYFCARGTPDGG